MSEGIKLFMEELEEESKIGVLVDSDVDGFTSGALVYLFLINECQYPKEKNTNIPSSKENTWLIK